MNERMMFTSFLGLPHTLPTFAVFRFQAAGVQRSVGLIHSQCFAEGFLHGKGVRSAFTDAQPTMKGKLRGCFFFAIDFVVLYVGKGFRLMFSKLEITGIWTIRPEGLSMEHDFSILYIALGKRSIELH
jgi:hypothetical protein